MTFTKKDVIANRRTAKFTTAARFTFLVVGLILLGLIFATKNPIGAIFISAFSIWPLLVTLALIELCPRPLCQAILAALSLCYGLCFTYFYLSAFFWDVDPQSPILLLFVGIYLLPVLVPVWGFSFFMQRKHQSDSNRERQ